MRFALLAGVFAQVSPTPVYSPTQDEVPSDEMIVYGEPFARWDDTRWLVQVEIGTPWVTTWHAFHNHELRVRRYQVHFVMHCDIQHTLAVNAREVICGVEEVAFRPGLLSVEIEAKARAVTSDWAARTHDASFQLQVTKDGRVTDIGIDGIETTDRRSRSVVETMRSALAGGLSGFHLVGDPSQLVRGFIWTDETQAPWQIPTQAAHPVSAELVHRADPYQGWIVVQSKGNAAITITPDIRLDARVAPSLDSGVDLAARSADSEMTFQATLDGVALFDPENGIMKERVTRMFATATASSAMQTTAHTIVRIRQLDDEEVVVLPHSGPVMGEAFPEDWF